MKTQLHLSILSLVLASTSAFAAPSEASRLAELESLVRSLQAKVESQQDTIDELKRSRSEEVATTTATTIGTPAAGSAKKQFLPDIGVVADIVASSTESPEDEEGNDRLSVREIEFVFGHDIDPYTRLDTVITFSDFEEPDIEEAKVTYGGLPLDTTARIGRMRQKVGKASALHRDALDSVDEPLVVQRYLGIEGLFRTGLEGSGFTPISGDQFTQELTLGVMEGGVGEDGELFGETRRRPSGYGHIANFIDISEDSSFELGGTYLIGSQDDDSAAEVQAFGLDATFVHYVTPRNKFKVQGELYIQDRNETAGEDGTEVYANDPYGFYVLADYRFADRWNIGARYDYVEPTLLEEASASSADKAYNAMLTFHQSEFARWRLQYQFADLADGTEDNRFFLQGTFAIGVHKHMIQ